MKKFIICLTLLMVSFAVGAQDPLFEEIPIAGVSAEDSPVEYGFRVILFFLNGVALLVVGFYILKVLAGMNTAHNTLMNSRNTDGSNDYSKTTGNLAHLGIAIVVFLILLGMLTKVNDAVDALFDENASMMIEGTDQYFQVDLIKRSA